MAIKGITLEIDGDTTSLSKALTKLNSPISKLDKELKTIQRSLNFQPGNTELLKQKFEATSTEVDNLNKKLKVLKEQKQGVDEKFKNGEISAEQYRQFNREIEKTENQLKRAEEAQRQYILETDRANSALGRLGDSATRAGSKLSQSGQTIEGIGNKFLPITAAIGALGVATAKVSVNFLSLKERTYKAFETLLGSANKANSMMDELYTFAKTTPFSYDTYLKAGQSLIAMGVSAQNTIPYLQSITDAAVGIGKGQEGINTIVHAFGKMQSKGKITLEELNMVTEAGIPAIKILANQYGVTTDTLYEMIRKGELMADQVLPKLTNGMNEGTKGAAGITAAYGGMAKEMKSTLSGAIDSTKSKFRNMSIQMWDAEAAYPELISAVNSFSSSLDVLPGIFSSVGKIAVPILEGVSGALNKVGDWADNASDSQLAFVGNLALTAAAAGPVLKITGKLIGTVGSMSTAFGKFSNNKTVMTLNSIATGSTKLSDAIKRTSIVTAYQTGVEKAKTTATIQSTTATAAQTAVNSVYTVGAGLAAAATKTFSMAMNALGGPVGVTLIAITALIPLISNMVNKQKEARLASSELAREISYTTKEVNDLSKAQSENTKSRSEELNDTRANVELMKHLADNIDTLADKENRSAEEKARLKTYVDQLNDAAGKTVVKYNEEKDALSKTTSEIREYIKATEKQIMAEAARKLASKAAEDMIKNEMALKSAVEEQTKAREEYNRVAAQADEKKANGTWSVADNQMFKDVSQNVREADENVSKLTSNLEKSKKEMEGYTSTAVSYLTIDDITTKLNELVKQGANKGKQLPEAIANGIAEGAYMMPESVKELNSLIDYNTLINSKQFKQLGISIPNDIATGIQTGIMSVNEAVGRIKAIITNNENLKTASSNLGVEIPANIAQGINSGEYQVQLSVNQMQDLVKLDRLSSKASQGGKSFVNKLTAQIQSGKTTPAKAVKAMNAYIKLDELEKKGSSGGKEFIKSLKEKLEAGKGDPAKIVAQAITKVSKETDKTRSLGVDFGTGYSNGINSTSGSVWDKAWGLAKTAIAAVKAGQKSNSPAKESKDKGVDFGGGYVVGILSTSKSVYSAGYSLAENAIAGLTAINFSGKLNTQITNAKKKIDNVIKEIDKGTEARARKKEIENRKEQKKQLAAEKKKAEKGVKSTKKATSIANSNVKKAENKVKKAEDKVKKAEKKLKNASSKKEKAEAKKELNNAKKERDKAKRELKKAKKDRDTAKKNQKKAKDDLTKANSNIKKADKDWADSELERKEQLRRKEFEEQKAYYEKQEQALQEYYSKVSSIQSKFESSDLLSEKNGFTILNDFEADNETLKELEKGLYKLENLKIPDDLFQMISDMKPEDALKYVEALNNMTSNELDKYISSWTENRDIANKIAVTFSKEELKELEEQFPSLVKQAEKAATIMEEKIISAFKSVEDININITSSDFNLTNDNLNVEAMKSSIASLIEALNVQAQKQQMAQGTALANALISSNSGNITIEIPVNLDGKTVTEVVAEYLPGVQKVKGV